VALLVAKAALLGLRVRAVRAVVALFTTAVALAAVAALGLVGAFAGEVTGLVAA
jgi:hypothetical protein